MPSTLPLASTTIKVNVRRRGMDPFLSGVVIGATAAVLGMLMGLFIVVSI